MLLSNPIRQFKIFVIVTSVVLLIGLPALAQFYPAKVYSIRDGLPTNSIYDIAQQEDKTMWFVTAKGVVKYDALNWTLFSDSLQLPNSSYSFLKPVANGSMWVAGQNSKKFVVKYYLNSNWHTINIEGLPDFKGKFSFDVNLDEDGYSIVISSRNITYNYHTEAGLLQTTHVSAKDNFNINASHLRNGKSYLCTSDGILVLDGTLSEHPVNKLLSTTKEVLQLYWQKDELYMLGLGWLGSYKNGEFQYLSTDTGIKKSSQYNKHNLTVDQFGRVFYSSNSAAKYLDKQSVSGKTLYVNGRRFNALSNKVYVDVENNVWVGDHRGLFKFNVLHFKNYNKNTGLAEDEVTAIMEYQGEMILANPKYLNFLKEGSVINKLSIGKELNTRVLDMAKDSKGNIYIAGSRSGLLLYDGTTVKRLNWKSKLNETGVTSVELFNNDLYFTSNQSVYSLKNGKIKNEIDISGIRNLQRINGDTLAALSTSEGFLFLDPIRSDTTRYVSSNRSYNNVYAITKWRQEYYLATAGGLATIRKGKIEPFFLDPKMNRVAIYSLLVDKSDRLWMGTNEGVFIWDGNSLANYNQSYGLVGDEVNRNAFVQNSAGNTWIGTENGASVYNASEDLSIKIIPQLHLGNIITQKGTVLEDSLQELVYNDNTIEFNFIGVSFFDEKQITYRYKLNGFDTEWLYIDNPNSNKIRYTNLPSGEFEFVVEAGLANTNWSSPATIKFNISPPFYTEPWFIVLTISLVVILIYLIYRIRFYVILKHQKQLKREVMLRTREIQEMNEEIQAQNEELKLQSEEIFTTNERLEEMVQERTRQLREQNKKLTEYAFINSHELRAPICRMLGLLNLLLLTEKKEHKQIIEMIHSAGLELDKVSKDINSILDTVDLTELEETNSIETLNALKKLN